MTVSTGRAGKLGPYQDERAVREVLELILKSQGKWGEAIPKAIA